MAKKSGVLVELISKFGGVQKQLIRKLGNKVASDIGFGPDYNVSLCETVFYGYADGIMLSPADACSEEQIAYEWDAASGILYNQGSCGTELKYKLQDKVVSGSLVEGINLNQDFRKTDTISSRSKPGYYSDGTTVYEWDGVSSFGFYGPCGKGRP